MKFWDRLDQNSGFHGNRKRRGKRCIHLFSVVFYQLFFSNVQVTRTGIKSWPILNFGQIGPPPTELGALERLKNFP